MLFLSFVATFRASDFCQGANVISCVTLVNLDYTPNSNAYFLKRKKKRRENLLVAYDTGKKKIKKESHYWFEERNKPASWGVIPLWKSVKIDSRDMKHLCFNFLPVPLASHGHTCGPARGGCGGNSQLWSSPPLFFFFQFKRLSSCRYFLSGSLPGSHINVWKLFLGYELKIYAVSLPWSPTVACGSGPQRPRAKRLWKIKHSGVGMGLLLLVCSHL